MYGTWLQITPSEQALAKPGLVCAFTAVEPCMSFEYRRSENPEQRGLKLRPRKCLHIYQVHLHPTFGFMNARIQTCARESDGRAKAGRVANGKAAGPSGAKAAGAEPRLGR
jgi:hypothetical protein